MARWCIGIDLGGTFIKFVALEKGGEMSEVLELPTPASPEGIVEQMIAGARRLTDAVQANAGDVCGLGIGAPGPLKMSEGIVLAMPNLPGMENLPLVKLVTAGFDGIGGVLENDANAAALGEYLFGAGRGRGDMVLLTLGTGVGSGVVIGGEILHGAHEMAAELGHMIIEPGGEPCGCGQRGCLERYCSATYTAALAARAILRDGRKSSLKEIIDRKGAIDAKDVNEARRGGDALAAEIWDRGLYYLALACVNVCRLLDPDQIVLAGGMTKAGADLMNPLQEHFRRLHWKITERKTSLTLAQLGSDAGAIGAAAVARKAFAR